MSEDVRGGYLAHSHSRGIVQLKSIFCASRKTHVQFLEFPGRTDKNFFRDAARWHLWDRWTNDLTVRQLLVLLWRIFVAGFGQLILVLNIKKRVTSCHLNRGKKFSYLERDSWHDVLLNLQWGRKYKLRLMFLWLSLQTENGNALWEVDHQWTPGSWHAPKSSASFSQPQGSPHPPNHTLSEAPCWLLLWVEDRYKGRSRKEQEKQANIVMGCWPCNSTWLQFCMFCWGAIWSFWQRAAQ